LERYKEKVKCIYIDPPYNTGNDEFLYKDKYQHSSWLSMLDNRLKISKKLMQKDGLIFTSIGDLDSQNGESYRMQFILNSIFEKRFGNLIWKKRGGIGSFSAKNLSENHEYILVNGNRDSFIYHNLLSESFLKKYKEKDSRDFFRWMELIGPSQQTKSRRPNLDYGILYDEKNKKIVGFEFKDKNKKQQKIFFDELYSNYLFCIKLDGDATWLIGKDIIEKYYRIGLINVFKENNKYKVKIKKYLHNEDGTINGQIIKSILSDNGIKIGMNVEATKQIKNLFAPCDYTYLKPKPVSLIKMFIYTTTTINHEIILDFFAGSGTTAHSVMKLNKEDNGRRKYILIEMADYFNTIIIPRLKKVCYSKKKKVKKY